MLEDYDESKPKNRKRIRAQRRKCKIPLNNFPRSSNIDEIINACSVAKDQRKLTPTTASYPVMQTLRSLGLINTENSVLSAINNIVQHEDLEMRKKELAMIISRSYWMKRWVEWANKSSIFQMQDVMARNFLETVSHGKTSTIKSTSYVMNSLLRFTQQNHPSRDSKISPDTKPWNELKRQEFERDSIFNSGGVVSAIGRVSHDAEFVRIATGYLSILGYDIVASNLNGAEVRILVGSNDTRGRMEISNAINDLRIAIESGPDSPLKHEAARQMRREIIGGGVRVRCLKARHTPDFHPKVQIFDRSAVLSGSFNLSYSGLVKNVENCEIVVDEKSVKYYIDNFDDYFLEATPIEDEILEMLDYTWAISSDELVEPWIAHLRVLLEIYGDSEDQDSLTGISLANYQEYSVNKSIRDLRKIGGSLLVAPTGTGKTLMGSIVARRMIQMNKVNRIFVIAPSNQILYKWKMVCLSLRIPFEGYTYAKFQRSSKDDELIANLGKSLCNNDLLIADECHTIRNLGSGNAKIMETIGKPSDSSPLRLFLTATPMSKNLAEINNLLEFTHGNAIVRKPIDVSKSPSITYLTHNLISDKFGIESDTGHRYVLFSGEKRFFAIKKTEQVRYESPLMDRVFDTLKTLPLNIRNELPKGQITLFDDDSGDCAGRSMELYRVILSVMTQSSPVRGLHLVNDLLESDLEASFFYADSLREGLIDAKEDLEKILESDQKLEILSDNIRKDVEQGNPVLIFAQYKDTVHYLEEKLKNIFGVVVKTITGDDGDEYRKETCKRFSTRYHKLKPRPTTDPKILIATDCISEGVDLPDAKVMVNYDLFWTPLKMVQRVGRLDRPTDEKRSFRAVNMIPSTNVYDSLFQMHTRLDNRSGMYREMSGIEVYRTHIRDLDNPTESELEAVRSMHGEFADYAFDQYVDQFATEVLGQLAKATEEEKNQAMALPTGSTSNCKSEGITGIMSVVRDADGYPQLLTEHYEGDWGEGLLSPDDQEEEIKNGMPPIEAKPVPIPKNYYPRHELMLSRLAEKHQYDIDEIVPVVNLIKSR